MSDKALSFEQAKDRVAIKYAFDWVALERNMELGLINKARFNKYINEAAELYAQSIREEKDKEINSLYKGRRTNAVLVEELEFKIKSQEKEIEALKQALRNAEYILNHNTGHGIYKPELKEEMENLLK